jgi:hypothetical protein
MGLQADMRAAAVTMMTECAADASVPLQVYPGRPRSINPPTGYVESMGDALTDFTSELYQHTPLVELVFVWGPFDSMEAANQRDAWVDAFHAWVRVNIHEAGARTLIGPRELADLPDFVPSWLPERQQLPYYATRVVLEGFATD